MRRALMLSAFVLSAAPLLAHHNIPQQYDTDKPVPLNGTVTAVQWKNPHVLVFVDSKDEAGNVVNWKIEMIGPLQGMSRQGFTKDSPRNTQLAAHGRDGCR